MNDVKELDCLLVEGRAEDGFLLKFTLRGENPNEMYQKWQQVKELWFPGLTPGQQQTKAAPAPTAPKPPSQSSALTCDKCGSPKIIGKNGKPYCKPCYIKWAEANKSK